MGNLIQSLLTYGTTPAILVLAALVGYLIRRDKARAKRSELWNKELRKEFADRDAALEKRFLERDEALRAHTASQVGAIERRVHATDENLDELSKRVSCVERDYLPREEYYRVMSGWRTEIGKVTSKIDKLFLLVGKALSSRRARS